MHRLLMWTPTPCNLVLLTRGQTDACACVETVTDFFCKCAYYCTKIITFYHHNNDFVARRGLLILKMIIQKLIVDIISVNFDYIQCHNNIIIAIIPLNNQSSL